MPLPSSEKASLLAPQSALTTRGFSEVSLTTPKRTMRTDMSISTMVKAVASRLRDLDEDQRGVAMTEYIIIFSLVTFGAAVALMGTAAYVKAYRDFMVWWLAHPAV